MHTRFSLLQALGQMLQAGLSTNPLLRGNSGASLARGSSGGAPLTPPTTPPGLAKQDVALVEGKAAPAGWCDSYLHDCIHFACTVHCHQFWPPVLSSHAAMVLYQVRHTSLT